jgi:hypothetical protein
LEEAPDGTPRNPGRGVTTGWWTRNTVKDHEQNEDDISTGKEHEGGGESGRGLKKRQPTLVPVTPHAKGAEAQ